MIEITKCPVCDGIQFAPFTTCVDHSVSHETFNIVRCADCELLVTNPRPTNEQLAKYYESPAYTSHVGSAKSFIDKIYIATRNFTLQWKLSLVKKNSMTSGTTILDYGCGVGEFLKVAKLQGWDTTGIEPSSHARQQAAAIISSDIKSSLRQVTDAKKKFDVITLWHVLEHVEDLDLTIQKLRSVLADHGTIFIAVPNNSSWDADHYKQYWAAYDVPRHIWHFKKNNLRKLMEKNAMTLIRILPMRLDAFYISLLSEKYKNGSQSVLSIASAFVNGLRSNYHARTNMEYSSLIYIVRNATSSKA